MARSGGEGPGVRADIAYETLSSELKELIGSLDEKLELDTDDIESIKKQLRKVSEDAKSRSFEQS